jgi:hypothetical protein
MKRILTAATAAFLLFFALAPAAYAEPAEDGADAPAGIETTAGGTDANPFTPAGAGTVTDYAAGDDGKEFYTITAPDDTVFYLVIDNRRGAENVYFLNAVTADDLMSLAMKPGAGKPGAAALIQDPAPAETAPAETPPPATKERSGNNAGMWIFIAVLAALGGGAAWYFKIYRKSDRSAGASEYEPPADEDENVFDDWYETDEDTPLFNGDEESEVFDK